jgi:hypothetical protein
VNRPAAQVIQIQARRNTPIRGRFSGNFVLNAEKTAATISGAGEFSNLSMVTVEGELTGIKFRKAGGRIQGNMVLTSQDGLSKLTLSISGPQPTANGLSQSNLRIVSGEGEYAGLTGRGTGLIKLGRIRKTTTEGPVSMINVDIAARRV